MQRPYLFLLRCIIINLSYNKEVISMTTIKAAVSRLAVLTAFFLSAVLFVGANSASSCVVFQPKAPESLRRFSKIK